MGWSKQIQMPEGPHEVVSSLGEFPPTYAPPPQRPVSSVPAYAPWVTMGTSTRPSRIQGGTELSDPATSSVALALWMCDSF